MAGTRCWLWSSRPAGRRQSERPPEPHARRPPPAQADRFPVFTTRPPPIALPAFRARYYKDFGKPGAGLYGGAARADFRPQVVRVWRRQTAGGGLHVTVKVRGQGCRCIRCMRDASSARQAKLDDLPLDITMAPRHTRRLRLTLPPSGWRAPPASSGPSCARGRGQTIWRWTSPGRARRPRACRRPPGSGGSPAEVGAVPVNARRVAMNSVKGGVDPRRMTGGQYVCTGNC